MTFRAAGFAAPENGEICRGDAPELDVAARCCQREAHDGRKPKLVSAAIHGRAGARQTDVGAPLQRIIG